MIKNDKTNIFPALWLKLHQWEKLLGRIIYQITLDITETNSSKPTKILSFILVNPA